MAYVFTTAEKKELTDAINWMLKRQAYEYPFDAQVSQQVALVAKSSGFTKTTGEFLNRIRDNPYSTMLQFVAYVGL